MADVVLSPQVLVCCACGASEKEAALKQSPHRNGLRCCVDNAGCYARWKAGRRPSR